MTFQSKKKSGLFVEDKRQLEIQILFLRLEKIFENICFQLSIFIFVGGIPDRIGVCCYPPKDQH